jgi:hypothetical protein
MHFGQVFMKPLRDASPPVISHDRLPSFMSEVFWNLYDILTHDQRMLGSLFARQREQHPIVQSVADIILDSESSSTYLLVVQHHIAICSISHVAE